jgi:hypothetical protein
VASAEEAPGAALEWRESWRRFGPVDGALTVAGASLAIVAAAIGPETDTPRALRLPIDESVRDGLRPRSFFAQQRARDASDQLEALNVSYPFLVDALILARYEHGNPDVARELALLDLEVFALTFGVQQTSANLVSRERPMVRECGSAEWPADTAACSLPDRYRGYFSGHTALSFAAATATCTHHGYLDLHGGHGEWIPCVGLLASAAATGTLRIVGDRHYFTDVATGAVVGGLIGWAVPFLHYQGRRRGAAVASPRWAVLPAVNGLHVVGSF